MIGSAGAAGAVGGGDLAGAAGKMFGGGAKTSDAAPASTPAPATSPAAAAPTAKRSFGLGNIKGFHMAGPFGFDVDVARDATQEKADARIGMSFTGGDWKLTRVVPAL